MSGDTYNTVSGDVSGDVVQARDVSGCGDLILGSPSGEDRTGECGDSE